MIRTIANNIAVGLRDRPWLQSVGLGREAGAETIFVYAKSPVPYEDTRRILRWAKNHPVVTRVVGEISPALALALAHA